MNNLKCEFLHTSDQNEKLMGQLPNTPTGIQAQPAFSPNFAPIVNNAQQNVQAMPQMQPQPFVQQLMAMDEQAESFNPLGYAPPVMPEASSIDPASQMRMPIQQNEGMLSSEPREHFVIPDGLNKSMLEMNSTKIDYNILALSDLCRHSSICPPEIRAYPTNKDKQSLADSYILFRTAKSLGLDPIAAYRTIFLIKGKISVSVAAKAAAAIKYGTWEVKLDIPNAAAIATGRRFDTNMSAEITYSAYDAALKGKMRQTDQGWIGLGPWADKWPDMLKVRALGRLLDCLFPDLLCGIASQEEADDGLVVDAVPKESEAASKIKQAVSSMT